MTDHKDANYPKAVTGQPLALETRDNGPDGRRYSPSVSRNRDAIADVFAKHATASGHVLEIASGTGEHGAYLTDKFGDLEWTYSDIDLSSQASQLSWRRAATHGRLHGPLAINAADDNWGEAERPHGWDVIVSINMIHIAPFVAAEGLISGAGRLLKPDGKLFLYGPFARNGKIAPSNATFSQSLQSRDPSWGVRDLDREIIPVAEGFGLTLQSVIEMPANNLSVVFERRV